MSGLFTIHVPDLSTEDGQRSHRRQLSEFTQQLVRGRLMAIPFYDMDIANHGFATMSRPWPGSVANQGLVAPTDLALCAYGYNFRGSKTAGTVTVKLQFDSGSGFNDSQWPSLVITSNADHGLLQVSPDLDVIPENAIWQLQNSASSFLPSGSTDLEVMAYLAPV